MGHIASDTLGKNLATAPSRGGGNFSCRQASLVLQLALLQGSILGTFLLLGNLAEHGSSSGNEGQLNRN